MDLDAIFIIGPQGSGKGTQAKILAEKLEFFHWNMGAVLRENHEYKFSDGETVGGIIDKGGLLPDDKLLETFKYKSNILPTDKGLIFDGIPRRLEQAYFIIDFLRSGNRKKFVTIFINIPKEETFKRLLLRAEKEKRRDDSNEGIEFRLKQYEKDTKPVLDYLKKETTFIEVDGRPSIPEVTKSIDQALGLE
jgi:adenylate kinase